MSVNEPSQVSLDKKYVVATSDGGDDMQNIDAPLGKDTWEDPHGELAACYGEGEGTQGRIMWEVNNEGVDLELVHVTWTISEGGENNRFYSTIGYDYAGTATVMDTFVNRYSPQTGGSGSYNRNSNKLEWPDDARPKLRTNDSMYINMNMSNPNNVDTTKGFWSMYFKRADGSGGARL